MKVLVLSSTLSFGGAERTAANISRALSAMHEVTVVVFHGHVTYPHGGKLVDCGFRYEPDSGFLRKPLRLYQKSQAFREVFAQVQPDVVLSFAEGQNLVALLNRHNGTRYVINSQIPPSLMYSGLNKMLYTVLIKKTYHRGGLCNCPFGRSQERPGNELRSPAGERTGDLQPDRL